MNEETGRRFTEKVDKGHDESGCWIWTGARTSSGYGSFSIDGKRQSAHRVAWEVQNGPIPDGMCVLHGCDVKRCVNPSHLHLGTNAQNGKEAQERGLLQGKSIRGESHHRAKLTEAMVHEVRRLHAEGVGGCRTLARRFGVTKHTVQSIVLRETWKHV